MICEYIADLFFYEITAAKPMFLQMFAIGLLFALYGKVMMTRQGYVSQMSFFIVYLGVVLLLLQSFALISEVVDQGIDRLVAFMTHLCLCMRQRCFAPAMRHLRVPFISWHSD